MLRAEQNVQNENTTGAMSCATKRRSGAECFENWFFGPLLATGTTVQGTDGNPLLRDGIVQQEDGFAVLVSQL